MSRTAGRVPVRLRIGVTGHREISDRPAIVARVDEVLRRLLADLPEDGRNDVLLEVVSPLGEGADRIVAERVLREAGAILECPLPLDPADYEQDFTSDGSREEFHRLLERSDHAWVVGGTDRIDSYRQTGAYVVDSCDLLIAIWDGMPPRGPGGTGDVVHRAEEQAMPVFWIGVDPPFEVRDPAIRVAPHLVRDIARFNDADLSSARLAQPISRSGRHGEAEIERLERCLSWAEPHYRRAAGMADRAQRRFTWGSRALFLLSAVAVLAVALSVMVRDHAASRVFAYLEVAAIVAALVLWLLVRHRLHTRWITARFLAERLRSAGFLAFAGEQTDIGSREEGDRDGGEDGSQEWVNRICHEVWRARPRIGDEHRDVEDVRALLDDGWVGPQLDYYEGRAADHLTTSRILTTVGAVLFGGTLLAAGLHASEVIEGGLADTAVVLSLALPAFAGALAGIAGLELHAHHGARFESMARRVGELRDRLGWAKDMDRVREVIRRIEMELRREGEAWVDVMGDRDVELPT